MSEHLSPSQIKEANRQGRRAVIKGAASALTTFTLEAITPQVATPAFLRFGRSKEGEIHDEMEVLAGLLATRAYAAEEWVYSPVVPWTNDKEFFPFLPIPGYINLQAENGPLGKFRDAYRLVTGRECRVLERAQDLAASELLKHANSPLSERQAMGKCHAKAAVGLLETPPTREITRIINLSTPDDFVDFGYEDRYGTLAERHSGDAFYRPYTEDELAAGVLDVDENGNYKAYVDGRILFNRFAEYFLNADLDNNPGARFEVNAPPPGDAGRWWRAVYGINQAGGQFAATSFTSDQPEVFSISTVQFAQAPVFPDQADKLPKSMRAKLLTETKEWRNPFLFNTREDRYEDFSLYLIYDPDRLVDFAREYGQSLEVERVAA